MGHLACFRGAAAWILVLRRAGTVATLDSRRVRRKSAPRSYRMGRIIVANRRGHQVIEWDLADAAAIVEAERILREARDKGCAISKKVGDQHVIDNGPFDPKVEEYQIIAPIAGG